MAKITIDTLLTKIGSIFKNDVYIIDNLYCIGGNESEDKNETQVVLQLSLECNTIMKELFPDNDFIYIKNIREAKKNLEDNISLKFFDNEKEDLKNRMNKVMNLVKKVNDWKNFDFTEEEANYVFDEGYSLEIFGEDTGIPSVKIAKNLFPLVTSKKLNDLVYHVFLPKSEDELVNLLTMMITDHYHIYNLIQYIPI